MTGRSPELKLGPTYLARAKSSGLLDEEHLAIGRERPEVVRDDALELVARFAQRGHRRDHRVAEMLRVLLCRPVILMPERLLEPVRAALELVGELCDAVEHSLTFG